MKIKLVTAYWMDCEGYPFQGTSAIRKERYLGSIKAHCENIGLPLVCYTHQKNFNELLAFKNTYQLTNLEIKILELYDMKLHKEISIVRDKHFDLGLNGRGTEILWGKIEIMEKESNDCDQLYWIDAGLQHPGIFPWRYSKKYNQITDHKQTIPNWWAEYDVYNFKELLNSKTLSILSKICENKIMFLTASGPQTRYLFQEMKIIDYPISSPYPIGGFFGGETKIVKKFVEFYWEFSYILLNKEHLCTEESIMKLCYDKLSSNEKINFLFDVHATAEHDLYHFEEWDKSKDPKPLYVVWQEILNTKYE